MFDAAQKSNETKNKKRNARKKNKSNFIFLLTVMMKYNVHFTFHFGPK